MVFRVLFAAAVSDCYLNGPALKEEEKLVAVAFSVIAILLNQQVAFLIAELAWFIVFARAGWENKGVEQKQDGISTTTTTAEIKKEEDVNQAPIELKTLLNKSLEEFQKNRKGEVSCDGKKWEFMSESSEGDKVWRAEIPGQSFYRWRADSTLYGPKSGVIAQMFDYNIRAGPNGWDSNIAKGKVIKEYTGGYKVCFYSSNPVFGGLITGREFLEGRLVNLSGPNGSVIVSGCGLDEKVFKPVLGKDFPQRDKNLTVATVFSGGGFYMEAANPSLDPETPQIWNYTLVLNTAIGGWIPAVTVNKATAAVLGEALEITKKHMKKVFPN